jgi:DNA-directed RNA polymerase omega subunit
MYKLPEDLESKYRFVTLAALRAEQLQAGAAPRVQTPSRKPTVIAQQEVADGVVAEWRPEEEGAEPAVADAGEEEE